MLSLESHCTLPVLDWLVTRRGTLLMETGLLHDYFENFSIQGKRYYFHVEGSMRSEIEPMTGKIETNLGNGRWGGGLKQTSENLETRKGGGRI